MTGKNEFNKIIRQALITRNMSITELSKRMGYSQPNISKKLKQNNLKESEVRKIAEILDMELLVKLVDKDE